MKQTIIYCLKVWLTSAAVTPLILMAVTKFFEWNSHEPLADYLGFYLACVVFGLAYSLLPFILVTVIVYRLNIKQLQQSKIKFIVVLIAEVLILAIMVGMDLYRNNLDIYTLRLWLPYAIVAAGGIYFYRLKPVKYKLGKRF